MKTPDCFEPSPELVALVRKIRQQGTPPGEPTKWEPEYDAHKLIAVFTATEIAKVRDPLIEVLRMVPLGLHDNSDGESVCNCRQCEFRRAVAAVLK